MTDEELKAGVQKIQTQLAEIQQKSRSKELRGILTDISGWSEKTAARLICTPGKNLSKETKSDVAIFLHFTYLVQAKNAARSKALHKLFDTLFRKHVSLFGQYINDKISAAQPRHNGAVS